MNQFIEFIRTTVFFLVHVILIALVNLVNFICTAWFPCKVYFVYLYHNIMIFVHVAMVHLHHVYKG
jgi:hypothetical protein